MGGGGLLSALLILGLFYLHTGARLVWFAGLPVIILMLAWGAVFLYFMRLKLASFTTRLNRTLDDMMNDVDRQSADFEAETLLARILHRLERLYHIMQVNRRQVEKEKFELQGLLSDISHQTKTPIANLKMINDTLLTRTMPEEKRREFLQAMESQLGKLDFLIQALVKTSRLETGVITLAKKDVPVADTLAVAINGVLAPLEQKRMTLSVDCPENLSVPHDRRWTSEALFNLLDNAVKYTPEGGRITVTAQSGEMYVKIDVADNGRGIPETKQAAIFKRFYREEDVHELEGVGIGLYLAREIITRQGGYIKVTSAVGHGSTFSLFLPRK